MAPLFVEAPDGLGIRLPRSGFKASGQGAAEAQNERGFVVRGGQAFAWTVERIRETDDGLLLIGQAFHGWSVDERLAEGIDGAKKLEYFVIMAKALATLAAVDNLPSPLRSAGVLLSQEGDVLILPPRLVARALTGLDPAEAGSTLVDLRSPLEGKGEASFFLAQLLYRSLSGKRAFAPAAPGRESPSASEEFVPLALLLPGLDGELSDLVDRVLAGATPIGPSDWIAILGSAGERGFFRGLSGDDIRLFETRRQAVERAISRRSSRRTFFRKRGSLLVGVAVVTLAVGIFTGSILAGRSGRPDLSSLSPPAL
ncbi:MAG: hypothetical protein WCL50_12355, partial [Spirochaetota bacterium]